MKIVLLTFFLTVCLVRSRAQPQGIDSSYIGQRIENFKASISCGKGHLKEGPEGWISVCENYWWKKHDPINIGGLEFGQLILFTDGAGTITGLGYLKDYSKEKRSAIRGKIIEERNKVLSFFNSFCNSEPVAKENSTDPSNKSWEWQKGLYRFKLKEVIFRKTKFSFLSLIVSR